MYRAMGCSAELGCVCAVCGHGLLSGGATKCCLAACRPAGGWRLSGLGPVLGSVGWRDAASRSLGGTDTSTVVLPGGAGMCGQGLVCVWERDSSTEQFCR